MEQLGFYLDMKSCIGCKVCQIACKDKNQLEVGTCFREVTTYEGGKFPKPWVLNFTMSCNHCGNPTCVESCTTGAIFKREEDGVVVIDKEQCIGCQRCSTACPYNAIKYLGDEVKKVGKCNLCIDLIEKGESPACVSGCLMRVLQYGSLGELEKKYEAEGIATPNNLKSTKPAFLLAPKK